MHWELIAQRTGESLPGHYADVRTYHLYERHQRPSDERCPEKRGAELRPRDGVGRNPRWIVISRTGDDASPNG